MTSTARPTGNRERPSRVLVLAGAGVVLVVAVTAVVGGLVTGAPAARGAAVGGAIALVFFLFGSLVVNTATRLAPQQALLVALTTYTLQVVVVAAVFVALSASDSRGSSLDEGWVAIGVIAATAAWMLGQLVGSARARVPAYDIDLPSTPEPASEPASEPAPDSTSHSTSATPSRRSEAGA